MPDTTQPTSLLEDLDRRQDDVLVQLDDLNLRIEGLLKEWLSSRAAEADVSQN